MTENQGTQGLSYLELAQRCDRLEDLVRWLALPYGQNRPIFSKKDPTMPVYRLDELVVDEEAKALYDEIVPGAEADPPGHWWQCPNCSMWQVRSGET